MNLDRMEARLRAAARRLPLGPHGPHLPRPRARAARRGIAGTAHDADADASIDCRDATPQRAARWDAFVLALPAGDLLPPRRLAAVICATCSATTRYFLYARARRPHRRRAAAGARQEPAVRQLAGRACRSRSTAASPPTTRPAAAALEDAGAGAGARSCRSQHLELRNVAPRHADWPRAGPLRRPSARRSLPTTKPTCWRSRASSARWCARASRTACASEIDAGVDRFFALYADNVHRHGTPALPQALLRRRCCRPSATTARC